MRPLVILRNALLTVAAMGVLLTCVAPAQARTYAPRWQGLHDGGSISSSSRRAPEAILSSSRPTDLEFQVEDRGYRPVGYLVLLALPTPDSEQLAQDPILRDVHAQAQRHDGLDHVVLVMQDGLPVRVNNPASGQNLARVGVLLNEHDGARSITAVFRDGETAVITIPNLIDQQQEDSREMLPFYLGIMAVLIFFVVVGTWMLRRESGSSGAPAGSGLPTG